MFVVYGTKSVDCRTDGNMRSRALIRFRNFVHVILRVIAIAVVSNVMPIRIGIIYMWEYSSASSTRFGVTAGTDFFSLVPEVRLCGTVEWEERGDQADF